MNREIIGQILLLLSSPTPTIRKLVWIISGTEYITLRRDLFWWAGSQIRTDVSLRIMITSQAESTTVPFRQNWYSNAYFQSIILVGWSASTRSV